MPKHKIRIKEGWYRVDELLKGEIVARGPDEKKLYIVGKYNPIVKAYELNHMDDVTNQSLVRGSTNVWAGFIY